MITTYQDFISESYEDLEKLKTHLSSLHINNYTIDPDTGLIDVVGDVELNRIIQNGKKMNSFPFKFGKIDGNFTCLQNELTSLKGGPHTVNGMFNCAFNKLTSLVGSPKIMNGDFYCHNNELKKLVGVPEKINGFFGCSNNRLTTLKGGPKIVTGSYSCSLNDLTSLEGLPDSIGGLSCDGNLFDIEDFPYWSNINGDISIQNNFSAINRLVLENPEIFKPLMNNKIKFHQMVMRKNPKLIEFYKNIPTPSKNSILFDNL